MWVLIRIYTPCDSRFTVWGTARFKQNVCATIAASNCLLGFRRIIVAVLMSGLGTLLSSVVGVEVPRCLDQKLCIYRWSCLLRRAILCGLWTKIQYMVFSSRRLMVTVWADLCLICDFSYVNASKKMAVHTRWSSIMYCTVVRLWERGFVCVVIGLKF